jgi:hypothetical protein
MHPENDPHPEHVPGASPDPYTQDIRHTSISARVPEKVNRGVFSTATMILQTSEEFVIDFLSTIAPPQQVVARVVLTPTTFAQMIAALRANISKYEQQLGRLGLHERVSLPPAQPAEAEAATAPPGGGEPPPTPSTAAEDHAPRRPPEAPAPPRIEDLYDQLKLPDELLGGVFANVVMIRHTTEEFCFDFIANFFPRSVVTGRVFFAAGRVPSFLEAMSSALRKYQQRGGRQPPP